MKVSPPEFMMANRKIIAEAVQKSQSLRAAWDFLAKELPKIKEVTKFNTFKVYVKPLLIADKKLGSLVIHVSKYSVNPV